MIVYDALKNISYIDEISFIVELLEYLLPSDNTELWE
jgi:hypothetical protein